MTTERPSPTFELKEILQHDSRVHIFPKRELIIPCVDDLQVARQFLPQVGYSAARSAGKLRNFLGMNAIVDNFGADQDERRKWRAELVQRFGMDFYNLFRLNNQLRGDVLNSVALSASLLRDYAEESHNFALHAELEKIASQIDIALNGKPVEGGERIGMPYKTLKSPYDKLQVVQAIEDLVIQDIGLFFVKH